LPFALFFSKAGKAPVQLPAGDLMLCRRLPDFSSCSLLAVLMAGTVIL